MKRKYFSFRTCIVLLCIKKPILKLKTMTIKISLVEIHFIYGNKTKEKTRKVCEVIQIAEMLVSTAVVQR